MEALFGETYLQRRNCCSLTVDPLKTQAEAGKAASGSSERCYNRHCLLPDAAKLLINIQPV